MGTGADQLLYQPSTLGASAGTHNPCFVFLQDEAGPSARNSRLRDFVVRACSPKAKAGVISNTNSAKDGIELSVRLHNALCHAVPFVRSSRCVVRTYRLKCIGSSCGNSGKTWDFHSGILDSGKFNLSQANNLQASFYLTSSLRQNHYNSTSDMHIIPIMRNISQRQGPHHNPGGDKCHG